MITLFIDGERRSVHEGMTLGEILPDRDPACQVAVIRPGARESSVTGSMRLVTTAGEITAELLPAGQDILQSPDLPFPLRVHWHDRYAVAFGPFPSRFVPARKPHLYERGDLILGCGGYDPGRSYLIFSKIRHTADHGAAAGGGVIGKVVSGRGAIDRWGTSDQVTAVTPVVNWADTSRSFTTRDSSLPLEDGMEIITHARITAQGFAGGRVVSTDAAETVEHMLLALSGGHFSVGRASSTYIQDERAAGTEVPFEVKSARREGFVTTRTRGRSMGSLYIYTRDIPASPSHTLLGQVTHGLELARLVKAQDTFCVRVEPERFDLVGLFLGEARALATQRGIAIETGSDGDNLVVVDQDPPTTLESLMAGKVTLSTVPLAHVIDITLDDSGAPGSCEIFRRLTGLHRHRVGKIPFFFHFEDVYLFKPLIPAGINIHPENLPSDIVKPGTLAMTNDSRRGSGLVGVRTSENSEFGPTSEPFEGTNIIGRVHDLEKLRALKENQIVFIREVSL
ncbi:MAG: methanogenesis marker 3 protein [Methanolinea sp.]|nr:methanogenesis marker 3 protein [Methanolinea sp.]